MLTDPAEIRWAGAQKGVTLIELLVAMLLLVMVTAMLYSVLNVGIKFSRKGEARLAVLGLERSFLRLLDRQVHGVWYDTRQKKPLIAVDRHLLKMVTSSPLIEHGAGLVLALYLYDPGDRVLYYAEKLDFFNVDYDEGYSPAPDEMLVLLREVDALDWQYSETEGELVFSYLDATHVLFPRVGQAEGGP
jgi:prepilin-type N-terminal cleavage/methylation domain-containing protein